MGVTGGIAAYKAANLASLLKKQHADVHVIMTKNAMEFITPLTFETLTVNKCLTDTFDRNFKFEVEHIELAKKADLAIIAPATANVCAKLAHGLADDMLTTTLLACQCPRIIAPAMNTRMYENPITQDNLRLLEHYGFTIIEPASGLLACGDSGKGKFPDEGLILEYILRAIAYPKDLAGKKILVTAGPTQGSGRSGALPHEPFDRKNGLCAGTDGDAARRRCDTRHRPNLADSTSVCQYCPHQKRARPPRGSYLPERGTGHHHQGGSRR